MPAVFSFTLGSNIQFFEIIGGDKIDKDDDGKIDNEYSVKGLNFTANFIYNSITALLQSWDIIILKSETALLKGIIYSPISD